MSTRRRSQKLAVGIAAAGSAGLVAATLAVGAGTSQAEPVSLTLKYTCPFPMIGKQSISVPINSDIPSTLAVGEPSGEIMIDTTSTVGAQATQGLNLVGAKTIEGKAVADSKIDAPEGALDLKVPATIEKTPVPAEGEFDVKATGKAPSITPSKAGTATITVGNLLLTLTPRDADGKETGLGTFDSACTVDEGQDTKLATIEITGEGGDAGGTETGGTETGGTETGEVDGGTETGGTETGGETGEIDGGTEVGGTETGGETGEIDGGTDVGGTETGGETGEVDGGTDVGGTETGGETGEIDGGTDVGGTEVGGTETGGETGEVDGGTDVGGTETGGETGEVDGGTDVGGTETGGETGEIDGGTETGGTEVGGTETGGEEAGGGGGDPIELVYDLAGESQVKTNVKGKLPLTGGIDVDFDLDSGEYTGDLTLDPTSGTFKIFGMMEAQSDVAFEQAGPTTGTFDGKSLTSSSQMFIKLTKISVFGFPIGGGEDCKTVEPAQVDMAAPTFDPFSGGTLKGEYEIPELENCGQFNDWISMFTAGPGNTVKVDLTEEG